MRLRLLATTDLHMHLLPWDYARARPGGAPGLALVANLVDAARAEAANTLLFDNGDFLQGSPVGDWLAEQGLTDQGPLAENPMITAMNALGYDAATLGNHEFSHGLPYLAASLAGAEFPVLSANLVGNDGALPVATHTLLTRDLVDMTGQRHRVTIGVTGCLPPQTAQWEARQLGLSLGVADMVACVTRAVAALRDGGADLVVVLAHTGLGPDAPAAGAENAGRALLAIPGVDALVAGHLHIAHPQSPEDQAVPHVAPGFFGSHLGVIDLTLVHRDGAWHVADHQAHLRPAVFSQPAHPLVQRVADRAHRATLDWLSQPVGRAGMRFHSFFALVAPCPAVRLVARAQAAFVEKELRNSPLRHIPVLSAAAPFKAGGRGGPDNFVDAGPGVLALRHVADLYPHPNTISALLMTGAELIDWLERAAVIFHRIEQGAVDAPLLRDDVPAFEFDLVDGVQFQIDLSQPARFDPAGVLVNPDAHRIIGAAIDGTPIAPDDEFILATNSFRASGSGGFPACDPDHLVVTGSTPSRAVLRQLVADAGAARPIRAGGWGFAPMAGTSVTFATSALARPAMPEVAHLDLQSLGMDDRGFQRFRLTLG